MTRTLSLGLLVLASGVIPADSWGQENVLTPEAVAHIRTVGQVAISPDGSAVAYTLSAPRIPGRDENGSAWTELHVVNFDGGRDRPFVVGEVNVSGVGWTPDGSHLSYLAKREGDEHTSIYIIPADAGESVRVYQGETNVLAYDWRPDGRGIAFIAAEPAPEDIEALREKGFNQEIYEEDWRPRRLFVVDLPEGLAGPVGTPRMIDVAGQPWSVDWSPDGNRLLTDLSPTPLIDDRYMSRRLHVVDAADGRVLARLENPGKLGQFGWSPDGKNIALVSARSINDPKEGRLMIASSSGGELRDLVPNFEGHVEAFGFAANDQLIYLASVGVGSRVARVSLNGRRDEVLYEGTDPVFTRLSLGDRGRSIALAGESAASPRNAYALRVGRDAAPQRVTDANPWLADYRLAQQEVVRWTAGDGLEIEGLLIHPLDRESGERVPTIVTVHGGPESHYRNGWLTSYSMPGQVAAAQGYAVLYPNYRGSTGRGIAYSRADQGDGMGAEFEDILAGIDYLIQRGLADADRVGITGGSYGGYATAWGSTRHSERFAAGVMFVGISNQLSKTGTSDIPREMEAVHWLTNPYENQALFLERSPISYVNDARTPLLILHGKDDPRVNPGQSRELYRALKMVTDVPVRLVLYPGEGHGNRKAAARYDYSLRMLRWFDHFLKQGETELPPWRIEYELEEVTVF